MIRAIRVPTGTQTPVAVVVRHPDGRVRLYADIRMNDAEVLAAALRLLSDVELALCKGLPRTGCDRARSASVNHLAHRRFRTSDFVAASSVGSLGVRYGDQSPGIGAVARSLGNFALHCLDVLTQAGVYWG